MQIKSLFLSLVPWEGQSKLFCLLRSDEAPVGLRLGRSSDAIAGSKGCPQMTAHCIVCLFVLRGGDSHLNGSAEF